MGQIIAFPIHRMSYPDRADALGSADRVLLIAVRWWVEDYRAGADPVPRLREALENAGAHDAAFSINGLMMVIARAARRPIDVHCPRCPNLSGDEKRLLHAACLAQGRNGGLAEKALRTALLSADGAAFALGELELLGDLFAKARLFFKHHTFPEPDSDDRREA